MSTNVKKQTGTTVATARELFEGTAGVEAAMRAGRNPQLKGIVHEVVVKNAYNMSPERLIDGTKAVLSKSSTAVRDDILIKQGSSIVGRMQLKDTPSAIAKTVSQVKDHHYAGTNLFGTKETVTAYSKAVESAVKNGSKITQKMSSTGVSSADTARIATKTIGSAAGKLAPQALSKAASSSGAVGAALSGGVEVISSGIKLANGEIDGEEFIGNVAKETIGGGLSAAGGTAAATAAAAGAATLLATTAAPVWVPAAIGVGAAMAVGSAIKEVWDFFWD